MPILNLNEGVPRTFHSARNLNARVPRTCFENILPGSCTENIYERAHDFLYSERVLKSRVPARTVPAGHTGTHHFLYSERVLKSRVPARTVPAGHTGTHHFLYSERVLKSRVLARTVPAGTRSKHVLGTNRLLGMPPKRSLNNVKPRTCSKLGGA